jgi:hypothetical protein
MRGCPSLKRANPQQALDINGTALFRINDNSAPQIILGFSNAHQIRSRHSGATSTSNAIDFNVWRATDLVATGAAVQVMTLQGDGKVGIGTNAPISQLDVNTPLAATATINTNANMLKLSRPTNANTKIGNVAQFDLGSYAINGTNALTRLDLGLNNLQSLTTSPVMTWQGNGNVGIGTAAPANKLEITQGTAGNSGLRFTNLNSASTATTSSSKVLGLNSTGDVILTNVPGTQNIVDFSTATPTTSGVVFTPNTPADESVVYQSEVDNSMWTYNGTAYVTYNAPASTAWFTAGTTNDAGNSKTSNIYRTGNVGIGTNNPATRLHIQGIQATLGANANAPMLRMSRPTWSGFKWGSAAQFNIGTYVDAGNNVDSKSRLDLALANGNDDTTLTTTMTWQANGNVGINTTSPSAPLVVQANTVGTGVLKLAVPSVGTDNWWMGFSHGINNSPDSNDRARIGVDIALGGAGRLFFTTGGPGAQTRAMFIDQNQRVGIGTLTPTSRLDVVSSTTEVARFTTSLSTTNYAGIGIGNASGAWGKIAAGEGKFQIRNFTTDATIINAELGTGNVGIGTTSPTSRLEVNGSATNSAAFNSGSATAILFNNSNLAYTSSSPTAFNLQGMKDGGTYTLAVQGTTSGTASFSGLNPSNVAFVFKSINNGITIAGKDTLYTFVVMGTTVYVYMATGF